MKLLTSSLLKSIKFILACTLLSSCSGFFDKDNTPTPSPLVEFKPEVQPQLLWSVKTGGPADEYLKLNPSLDNSAIYTASLQGKISSINQANGRINWQTDLKTSITTGPAVGDGIVVVGSQHGEVVALKQSNGQPLWRYNASGELLAKPAVRHGIVVIKTVGGHVRGLSTLDGAARWSFTQTEPALILYGASAPQISGQHIIIGFANGSLAKLGLTDGQLAWQHPLTRSEGVFAIERMIDIDADPILFEQRIFAATYQGKIVSLDWVSGRILWSHEISSYTGMTADQHIVAISDAKSHVWSFNANSGAVNWRQTRLEARIIAAPAMVDRYIVVGDAEGYAHWLSKHDGHFAARVKVGSGIYATPLVQNRTAYFLTRDGYLTAYRI